MNRSAKGLLIVTTNLDGLVWQITDDSLNLSNFLPIKLSRYTVRKYSLHCKELNAISFGFIR